MYALDRRFVASRSLLSEWIPPGVYDGWRTEEVDVARIGFTSSGAHRFVPSESGPGLISTGLPLADGGPMQSHGGLMPWKAEALNTYPSVPEFDYWSQTTHAAGL
jgi:hypothetical protein